MLYHHLTLLHSLLQSYQYPWGLPHSLMAHQLPLHHSRWLQQEWRWSINLMTSFPLTIFTLPPTLTDHGWSYPRDLVNTSNFTTTTSGHFYLMTLQQFFNTSLSNKFFIIHYASITFPPPTHFSLHSPSLIFIPFVNTLFSFAPLSFCCTCLAKCQPKLNPTIYLHHACTWTTEYCWRKTFNYAEWFPFKFRIMNLKWHSTLFGNSIKLP